MIKSTSSDLLVTHKNRLIGRYGDKDKPLKLICIAAIHGNEQAGILALKQVFDRLKEQSVKLNGELIALIGNIKAVQQNTRFINEDLNRIWSDENISAAISKQNIVAEEQELLELHSIIEAFIDDGFDIVLLDLHTMSSDSNPFITYYNTNDNNRIALYMPVPKILGLEDFIPTTLIVYYSQRGIPAIVFEGGQHKLSSSVLNIEAAVWQTCFILNLIRPSAIEKPEQFHHRLERITMHLPDLVEITYQHQISADMNFKMEAGFDNLHPIKKGQLLATDRFGDIKAPKSGRIILPLYQGLGNDGFFIGRKISKHWLHIKVFFERIGHRIKNF